MRVCSPAAMPSCASCMPASAAQTCGPTAAACPRSPVRIGHEFLGVVEAIGSEVEEVDVGDLVLSPFTWSDGNCEQCQRGLPSACVRGGFFGGPVADGGQGEAVRVPQADGALVKLPSELAGDDRLRSVLPLTEVMPTGHHAAVPAGAARGGTVVVVGDGAVGLCGCSPRPGWALNASSPSGTTRSA